MLEVLKSNEDNLCTKFYGSLYAGICIPMFKRRTSVCDLSTIVTALWKRRSVFCIHKRAIFCSVFAIFVHREADKFKEEAGEQLDTGNTQAKSIEACYEYLFSNADSREKSGLDRTLLHML